jgi:lysophospholipase L1-like esterase
MAHFKLVKQFYIRNMYQMKNIIIFSFLLIGVMAFTPKKKINVWLIGDSTMAWKKPENDPESGWGEGLKVFFNGKIVVHNHAASGRSTKSFVSEKRWQAVLDSIQPGDYVVIQFGHNDEKPGAYLHTDPFTTYKEYLKKFVDETRSKKGIPIICSSIVRRHFDGEQNLKNTHGDYIKASSELGAETKTLFIDMEAKSRKLVTELGPEKSKSLFTFCKPGECPRRPNGVQDSTHLNHNGAQQIAALFVEGLKEQKIKLAKFAN